MGLLPPRFRLVIAASVGVFAVALAWEYLFPANPDYSRTPVLFVHGHGCRASDFKPMIRHLVAQGYPRDYLSAPEITPNTSSNVRAAEEVLAPAVDSLLGSARTAALRAGHQGPLPERVDVVGWSMGAVSGRWYAARRRPDRVRTFVSLAGSNHGTNALCPYEDEGGREMCPAFATDRGRNPVQVALNGTPSAPADETPYGFGADRDGVVPVPRDATRNILYLTVRVEPDEWINPERSATLDGAGGMAVELPPGVAVEETSPGNYLLRERADHVSVLRGGGSLRLVTALLAARDAAK